MRVKIETKKKSRSQFCDDQNETLGYASYNAIELLLDEEGDICMRMGDDREENDGFVISMLTADESEILATNLLKLADLRRKNFAD